MNHGPGGQGVSDDALPIGLPEGERAEDLEAKLERAMGLPLPELVRFVSARAYLLAGADRDAAEDLAQDVLLTLVRFAARKSLHTIENPFPYLMQMTRNKWIDRLRAESLRRRCGGDLTVGLSSLDAMEVADPSATAALEAVDVSLDARKAVTDAAHRLSATNGEAIELMLAGYSQAEAATHLGIPVTTYRSRLHVAMRELRLALQTRSIDAH